MVHRSESVPKPGIADHLVPVAQHMEVHCTIEMILTTCQGCDRRDDSSFVLHDPLQVQYCHRLPDHPSARSTLPCQHRQPDHWRRCLEDIVSPALEPESHILGEDEVGPRMAVRTG